MNSYPSQNIRVKVSRKTSFVHKWLTGKAKKPTHTPGVEHAATKRTFSPSSGKVLKIYIKKISYVSVKGTFQLQD